jgi:phage head maturation protease
VSQCSFGFYILADESSEDADHSLIRTLTEISLQDGDVSPVVYPAYPDTEVDLRSREAIRTRLEATVADGLKRIGRVRGDDPEEIRAYFDARRRKLDLVRNS